MDRSIYPEAVEVHQTALDNTETTRSFHIRQRWQDSGQSGVATGLEVTVNGSNPIRIDIAAGSGYAPNNEYAELTASQVGVALASTTIGTENLVCLVYTETETQPEAHAYDGTTRATRAERAVRTRVFTRDEYDALPATDDDLTVDALDRTLVIAIVTPSGTSLISADIQGPPANSQTLRGMDQPTNITGLVILSVSDDTLLSAAAPTNPLAQLKYESGATPPGALYYRAPGDGSYGAGVPVTADGTYVLTSSGTATITVLVYTSLLPQNPSVVVVDNLDVYDVYDTEANRFSAADVNHRSTVGSLIPNRDNPHGQRIGDFGDKLVEAAHGVVLGTGLEATLAGGIIARATTNANTAAGGRTLLWQHNVNVLGVPNVARLYNYFGAWEFTVNARWDGASWNKDVGATAVAAYKIALGSAVLYYGRTAASAIPWSDAQWTSTPLNITPLSGVDSLGDVNITARAILGANTLDTVARQLQERVFAQYAASGSHRTLMYRSNAVGTVGATTVRVYRAIEAASTSATATLEITFNCAWDGGGLGGNWTKDDAASAAAKIELSGTTVTLLQRLAASGASFTDSIAAGGWDAPRSIAMNLSNGQIIGGNIFSSADFQYLSTKTFHKGIPGLGTNWIEAGGPNVISDTTSNMLVRNTGNATSGLIWASVEVPDGATIVGMTVNGTFAPAAGLLSVSIIRVPNFAGTPQNLRSLGALALSGTGNFSYVADQYNLVDNSSYSYLFRMDNGGDSAQSWTLAHIDVVYEMDVVSFG